MPLSTTQILDLAPQHLATVRAILQTTVPSIHAFAFGSRVHAVNTVAKIKKHSDVDIALEPAHPLGWRVLADVREAFEESDLPMRVDVIDWSVCTDDFKHHVVNKYSLT
jgi:uncharacterized protein